MQLHPFVVTLLTSTSNTTRRNRMLFAQQGEKQKMFFNVAVFLLLFLHTRRCIPFWIDCVVYVWDGRNEICTSSDNTLFLNSHRADDAAAARCANFAYVYFVFYMHCAEQTIYSVNDI